MDTAHIREQHFMAISLEVEVLCQQLKGKGVYPAPPTYTQTTKPNVHFQPIQPAKLTPLQTRDRLFFDPLLNTTEDQPDRNHTVVMTPCRATILHHPKYSLHHHVYQNLPSHQHHMRTG